MSSDELVCRKLEDIVDTAKLVYYSTKTLQLLERYVLDVLPKPGAGE